MIIYPGSHHPEDAGRRDRFRPVRVGFEVGDVMFFHPRLIHLGDRYVSANIRLHYYVFAYKLLVWDNITFPVRGTEARLMQWTAVEIRRVETLQKARGEARMEQEEKLERRRRSIGRINQAKREITDDNRVENADGDST